MKFTASSPENTAELKAIGDRLREAVALYEIGYADIVTLQTHAKRLREEERSDVDKLQNLPPDKTRPTALNLAAVRLELSEVDRRLPKTTSELYSLLTNIRDCAMELGNALAPFCNGFPESVREAFIGATSEFFERQVLPNQLAAQSDMFRACVVFSMGLTRSLRVDIEAAKAFNPAERATNDKDLRDVIAQLNPGMSIELIAEAQRRLGLLEAILSGKPVFEYRAHATSR